MADRALASENDAKDIQAGVAEIQVSENAKLIGLLEDLSQRLKKLETSAAKKKHYSHKQTAENRKYKQTVLPHVNLKPFMPNVYQDYKHVCCVVLCWSTVDGGIAGGLTMYSGVSAYATSHAMQLFVD